MAKPSELSISGGVRCETGKRPLPDLLRELFQSLVRRCMAEGLVGGEGFAVDASIIRADASRYRTAVDCSEGLRRPSAVRCANTWSCPGGLRRSHGGDAQLHVAIRSALAVDRGPGPGGFA